METDLTKTIKRALLFYDPAAMARGIHVNKFRPRHTFFEVPVDNGCIAGGIVDCLLLAEFWDKVRLKHACRLASVGVGEDDIDLPAGCPRAIGRHDAIFCEAGHDCTYQKTVSIGENNILFTCCEVKVSRGDFLSAYGHNFVGNLNYYVMPMELYKLCEGDIPEKVGVIALLADGSLRRKKDSAYTELTENAEKWLLMSALKAKQREVKRIARELGR